MMMPPDLPFVELPPGTELIAAIRAAKSSFHSWAAEGIDNALDAQATLIEIVMNTDMLTILDNGIGITRGRADAMVTISEHAHMPSTRLGKYGVGMKFKAIVHGNLLTITSISRDGLMKRHVDWEKLRQSRKWIYEGVKWQDVDSKKPPGTRIDIGELHVKPRAADIELSITKTQRLYYPAIEDGAKITINGRLVAALAMPVLSDAVDATLTFPAGRSARIRAGLLVGAESPLRQVDLCFAYRVIMDECSFGCDNYSGTRSMYARIDLIGPWQLTHFKDDIADPLRDDLEAAVEDVLRPILEKCHSQEMVARDADLQTLLNEMIPEEKRLARPKAKQPRDRHGEKRQDTRERTLPDATLTRTGPVRTRKPPPGFIIEFADDLCAEHGYGRAEVDKHRCRVQLARDCAHVAELMQQRDRRAAAIGLYAIALLILAHAQNQGEFEFQEFGLRAWRIGQQQELPADEPRE